MLGSKMNDPLFQLDSGAGRKRNAPVWVTTLSCFLVTDPHISVPPMFRCLVTPMTSVAVAWRGNAEGREWAGARTRDTARDTW